MNTNFYYQSGFETITTIAASPRFKETEAAITSAVTQIIVDPLLLLPRSDRGRLPRKAESALKERDDMQYQSDMKAARILLGQEISKANTKSIAAIRLLCGYSQQQVAVAIGGSQSIVAKIEAGGLNIQRDTMHRLSKLLGITMLELDEAFNYQ
jgi:ribosome-binding protein aMBF1 (putative translation factor)